ncbi:uncharacterized protein PV06_11931, partial [Exophiala oligosperma]
MVLWRSFDVYLIGWLGGSATISRTREYWTTWYKTPSVFINVCLIRKPTSGRGQSCSSGNHRVDFSTSTLHQLQRIGEVQARQGLCYSTAPPTFSGAVSMGDCSKHRCSSR